VSECVCEYVSMLRYGAFVGIVLKLFNEKI
jgi:hypothetical protein